VRVPAIPDLFLVGEVQADGPRRFYVYPYTVPPATEDLAHVVLQTKESAVEHAARLNSAVRLFFIYVFSGALGALADSIVQWSKLPGSPASLESQKYLVRLARSLLAVPGVQRACAFFQERVRAARQEGRIEVALSSWLAQLRGHGHGVN
jgi:hypothetical protein